MTRITTIITAFMLLLTACSSNPQFTIEGTIEGAGARTVVLTCYIDGAHKQISVPCTDGKFAIAASVSQPSLASLALSDGTLLANLIVENGMELTVTGSIENPRATIVEGDDASQLLSEWRRDNAMALERGDAGAINKSIASFISDNLDSPAAIALLVTQFRSEGYEKMADSLFMLIPAKSRPVQLIENFNAVLAAQLSLSAITEINAMTLYERRDTLISYAPVAYTASVLCFVPADRTTRDSIIPRIRALVDSLDKDRFRAIEIATTPDSALWASSVKNDSATWDQTWTPGSVSSSAIRNLAVPRSPYFIVADSHGSQIYRGASVTAAERCIHSQFDNTKE